MDILSITKRRWSVLFFNILSMCFLKNTDYFNFCRDNVFLVRDFSATKVFC